jgi:hypothetical protein
MVEGEAALFVEGRAPGDSAAASPPPAVPAIDPIPLIDIA